MVKQTTLKNRAVLKVITCIDSSKTQEHMEGCKKMLDLIYNYDIKNRTLTYLALKYKQKLAQIKGDI